MAGTWNCLTLVFFQAAVPAEERQLSAKPSMRFVPPTVLATWNRTMDSYALTPYQFGRFRLYDEKRNNFARALHEGKARILLGTDTPNPFVVPGFSLHEELQNLVKVGFTPFEALRAGTSDAVEFLKKQNVFGRVAVGLRADLLLLEMNPLEDVANMNRRAGVMVHGRWFPEPELKARLERLAASYARPSSDQAQVPH
jgi:hypothetical protein